MLFLLLATVFAAKHDYGTRDFDAFVTQFDKVYNLEEKAYRLGVFKQNLKILDVHNAGYEAGNHTWYMKVTQFADMTPYEFTAYVKKGSGGGFVRDPNQKPNIKVLEENVEGCGSIDWVSRGAVTPVKNQGNCGSCWSFSTTGAVEGRYAIARGTLNSLSEQELVDCDHRDSGCNGGLMDYGFYWIMQNGGICSESSYPYTSGNTGRSGSCQKNYCSNVATVSTYNDVRGNSQSQMESAVCQGPVSVAIEADQYSFQMYGGGVLTGRCGAQLDHGVLTVGYGTDSTYGEYWKVKNSWGATWGEGGYIRLCKNCGANSGAGQCGLLSQPSYPVV